MFMVGKYYLLRARFFLFLVTNIAMCIDKWGKVDVTDFAKNITIRGHIARYGS